VWDAALSESRTLSEDNRDIRTKLMEIDSGILLLLIIMMRRCRAINQSLLLHTDITEWRLPSAASAYCARICSEVWDLRRIMKKQVLTWQEHQSSSFKTLLHFCHSAVYILNPYLICNRQPWNTHKLTCNYMVYIKL